MRPLLAFAMLIALAGCGRIIPQGSVPPPVVTAPVITAPAVTAPVAANAVLAGIAAGPAFAALSVDDADARGALASFIESCPKLLAAR